MSDSNDTSPPPADERPDETAGDMPQADDAGESRRPLSEITHLFLSDLRAAHAEGRKPPRRVPPGGERLAPEPVAPLVDDDFEPDALADLASRQAEELASLFADVPHLQKSGASETNIANDLRPPARPVVAVIGAKLHSDLQHTARRFATAYCARGERVGLIIADADQLRLMFVEPFNADQPRPANSETAPHGKGQARLVRESLMELAYDVDRWLLVLPSPRQPHCRSLLEATGDWVLLASCDHDGVVGGYRTLKGLVGDRTRPNLRVVLVNEADGMPAPDPAEAARHAEKLAGVCKQFLEWDADITQPTFESAEATEHGILWCHVEPQSAVWAEVARFLAETRSGATSADGWVSPVSAPPEIDSLEPAHDGRATGQVSRSFLDSFEVPDLARPVGKTKPAPMKITPTSPKPAKPAPAPAPVSVPSPEARRTGEMDIAMKLADSTVSPAASAGLFAKSDEVIDLPAAADATGILAAVATAMPRLAITPVSAPAFPEAKLAVDADGALVLLAVAVPGMAELGRLGQAMRWVSENRSLIGLALSQYKLDATRSPRLVLLVAWHDVQTDAVQTLMAGANVELVPYRTVTWGSRRGLLLEAA